MHYIFNLNFYIPGVTWTFLENNGVTSGESFVLPKDIWPIRCKYYFSFHNSFAHNFDIYIVKFVSVTKDNILKNLLNKVPHNPCDRLTQSRHTYIWLRNCWIMFLISSRTGSLNWEHLCNRWLTNRDYFQLYESSSFMFVKNHIAYAWNTSSHYWTLLLIKTYNWWFINLTLANQK